MTQKTLKEEDMREDMRLEFIEHLIVWFGDLGIETHQIANSATQLELIANKVFTSYRLSHEAEMQNGRRVREILLRFYASMKDSSYDSVVDEYQGRPKPGQDKYTISSNKLYVDTETATARLLAPNAEKDKT